MSLWNELTSRLRHARIARFEAAEKRALVRLAWGIARADNDLTNAELESARALARDLGVDLDDAIQLGMSEAVDILRAKPAHLELACLVVADVVFVDGDYSQGEQAFVHDFSTRHGLPKNVLEEAVLRLRQQKLDAALHAWHDEILAKKL